MNELSLAGLRVHSTIDVSPGAALPRAAVILLHGYGAPGTDLVSLADDLWGTTHAAFFFPEGPLDLAAIAGPGYASARAWWPIDMARLQVAMLTGAHEQAARSLASGLDEARSHVSRFVTEFQERFYLPPERIVLGGFSQGSIVSLEVALTSEQRFAGLWLMSTSMLDEERLKRAAQRRVGMQALISHGRQDPVLPFAVTERMVAELKAAEWDVHWVPFAGGHGVPPEVIDAASDLLPKWLA